MEPYDRIDSHFRLNQDQAQALKRLDLILIKDLLFYFPNRYEAPAEAKAIAELKAGEEVIIFGQVLSSEAKKAWKKKIPLAEATVEDTSGKIKVIWFHQAYMAKKAPAGSVAYFRGKVAAREQKDKTELYLTNPEIIFSGQTAKWSAGRSLFTAGATKRPMPIYPETKHLSSGWFYHHIQAALRNNVHQKLTDPLSAETLKSYHLPSLATALAWIHAAENEKTARAARKRFAFEEVFYIQLSRLKDRLKYKERRSLKVPYQKNVLRDFLNRLPFSLTPAQTRATKDLLGDLAKDEPMIRLLEGDVGSGKTAVAAASALMAVSAGYQVCYMAPTEILARQHFESFIGYFAHLGVSVALVTSAECRKFPSKIKPEEHTRISRTQTLKWVKQGEIPIVIGTHALIQDTVEFKHLAYIIIDEQHRFGVTQRAKLVKKSSQTTPHLLSMTATPIPRTLALTIYGDLDLTLLDELPPGRKEVKTEVVPPKERDRMYKQVKSELAAGHQAFVICPRIDEPDPTRQNALQVKSAKTEAKKLKEEIFPEYSVGLVHSKLKPTEKENEMADFVAGKIKILVATSVVEVGVNIPNATVMIIEGADRFGLAQLHQLRGRVARSESQAYCFLLTDSNSGMSNRRLKALTTAKTGFQLAELDLALRGSGELSGGRQWGISDVGMEAIKNIKMVEAARKTAQSIIDKDPDLSRPEHQILNDHLTKLSIHFE